MHQKAQTLTRIGQEQLDSGQTEVALETWQKATDIYKRLHYEEGVAGTLINQSIALKALGQYYRACDVLVTALKFNFQSCDLPRQIKAHTLNTLAKDIEGTAPLPVNVVGLQNLGDVLNGLGQLDDSKKALQKALQLTQRLIPDISPSNILLSLGNLEQSYYIQARDRYIDIEDPDFREDTAKLIQQKMLSSLSFYNQAQKKIAPGTLINLQAKLNSLSLLLNVEKWSRELLNSNNSDIKTFHDTIQAQLEPLANDIRSHNAEFDKLPTANTIYAWLNFADSLSKLENNQLQLIAIQYASAALKTARTTNNPRLESYSLGAVATLYRQAGKPYQTELEGALQLAQSIQAWDIAYRWQWQLGQLYRTQGQSTEAISAYEAAIVSLSEVRHDLLSVNLDLQFSFREQVEPVYREYMQLVLATQDSTQNQTVLKRVVETNDQLQLAELENFLQCSQLNLVALDRVKLRNSSTIIHIIDLGDSIAEIVRSTDGLLHYSSPNSESITNNAKNLALNLQNQEKTGFDQQSIIIYSQALYKELIAPVKAKGVLPKTGTLVFVIDSSLPLQNIPMSILHDGQNYLIENYSTDIIPGSQLQQPKLLLKNQRRALIAGLTQSSPSFNDPTAPKNLTPLPAVRIEVASVKSNTTGSLVLLDQQFTSQRFQSELDKTDYPIIHITTHGQFSSDSAQTVLLAWDRAINVKQLNDLLQARIRDRQTPIELLVLSACETAKGDKRSALGIAGVAAQTGARSILASLWIVDAGSTAELMSSFYQGLRVGMTKAEALRQAQLAMLSEPQYGNPYFWSGFILVGSWL